VIGRTIETTGLATAWAGRIVQAASGFGPWAVLAVGSAARSAQAPNVPTLAEQGVSGFDVDLWYGLLAPAGTSPEIVARYNGVLNEILAQASVREALAKQGMDVKGGPPARLAELIANDQPRWSKVVKDAGITPE